MGTHVDTHGRVLRGSTVEQQRGRGDGDTGRDRRILEREAVRIGLTLKATVVKCVAAITERCKSDKDFVAATLIASVISDAVIVVVTQDAFPLIDLGREMINAGHMPKVKPHFDCAIIVWAIEPPYFHIGVVYDDEEQNAIFYYHIFVRRDGKGYEFKSADFYITAEKGKNDFEFHNFSVVHEDFRKMAEVVLNFPAAYIGYLTAAMETGGERLERPSLDTELFKERHAARGAGSRSINYRVCHVDPDVARRIRGEDKGGTHASPKWHMRIGHVRHLPTGKTTWVKSCEVGDKARGMVIKDYVVGREA